MVADGPQHCSMRAGNADGTGLAVEAIVEVGDPEHVEVIAEFLSQDAVRMKPGSPAQVENWGGPPLPAVVGRVALSLDFRGPSFQGPPALLDDTDCWPQTVIAMTLARVGSGAGPDLDRLGGVRDAAPGRKVYAAGGVRDIDDLITLKRAGIAGALVASCLHDGRLRGGDIATL